jgi:hypothetical protein
MPAAQSALVVLVPEAEALVGALRARFDPSASQGVPAHVTLLYPFLPPDEIGADVTATLRRCFAQFAVVDFRLAAIRQIGGELLYLAPDPDEPFRRLTLAIWKLFPDHPPYDGKHPEIVPHLTVASITDAPQFQAISESFARTARAHLPIHARAMEVALIDNMHGRWQTQQKFSLSGTPI